MLMTDMNTVTQMEKHLKNNRLSIISHSINTSL